MYYCPYASHRTGYRSPEVTINDTTPSLSSVYSSSKVESLLSYNATVSILDKRFGVRYDGTNTTAQFKAVLDYAVANRLQVIVPPYTYTVASLNFPSNLQIHFIQGAVMRLVPNSPAWTRCVVMSGVSNINVTGAMEIDGSINTITAGNEHMHGLFIYNARNIAISNLYSHDCFGDNISISGGGDSEGNYSQNINLQNIRCLRAGRKNLVIEHVDNLNIESADLDNTTGGTGGLGGNSIDVEPFNFTGTAKKFYVNLGSVITRGTGNDFSSGVSKLKAQGFVINIANLESYVFDLPTNDTLNAAGYKTALFCFGITMNITNFKAYLASTVTALASGAYTKPAMAIQCQHSSYINISNAEIYGGVPDKFLINLEIGTEAKPIVNIESLKINSPNSYGIRVERADLCIGKYRIDALKNNAIYCNTISSNTVKVGLLDVENSGTSQLIALYSGTSVSNASFIFENIIINDTRATRLQYLFGSDNAAVVNAISIGNVAGLGNTQLLGMQGALSADSDFSIKSIATTPIGSLVYVFNTPEGRVTADKGTIAVNKNGNARLILFIKETNGLKTGWRAL